MSSQQCTVSNQPIFPALLRSLRMYQWVKNLLLFLPMFAAHQYNNALLFKNETIGFLAFCFCASGVYIFNDLLDIESDKQHPTKKHRVFAAGEISSYWGFIASPVLWTLSFFIAFLSSKECIGVLVVYLLCALTYSIWFKKIVFLDVIVLSFLYMIRIIAGGVIGHIYISEWLIAFSMFLFFSLALAKRVSELQHVQKRNKMITTGRGYLPNDMGQLAIFGSCSGYIAILIFSLYINSPNVVVLYQHPTLLWLCCPILLYWISRFWLLTHRQTMLYDPVLFAVKDKQSYFSAVLIFIVLLFAK